MMLPSLALEHGAIIIISNNEKKKQFTLRSTAPSGKTLKADLISTH